MNIANKLVVSRVLLALVFMIFFYIPNFYTNIFALIIFILASISDTLDGYLARKNKFVTDFGKIFDSVADKILLVVVVLALVEKDILPSWLVSLMLFREFAVTGIRVFAAKKNWKISAKMPGKVKFTFQTFMIFYALLYFLNSEYFEIENLSLIFSYTGVLVLAWISLFLSYYSGFYYLFKYKDLWKKAEL
ncbi:CDP-diacylglycerol--glycerol-3-phosphate 3-phosphatidyltransferase [Candidatus Dojkabacteria bacterium]|nr:CDP-diacylglycerol--glycerol-3-phosphate 3-phosphatidyltransferase [Candidatus Dojkabacteria bacterium]